MTVLFFCLLYSAISLFKVLGVLRVRREFTPTSPTTAIDDVAILQAILSGDPALADVLESNVRSLPEVTFYWLIDEQDTMARETADTLMARYAAQNIVVMLCPPAPSGTNPKLFKLTRALRACTRSVCVVLDDDTHLPRDTLDAMLGELDHAELVTGLPRYREQGRFFERLLAAFVNDNAPQTYLSLLPYVPPVSINGMCYGFKRQWFESSGGFDSLLTSLADDLAVAEQVLAQGGTIRQIPQEQQIRTTVRDAGQYFTQMHRWYVFASLLFFRQRLVIRAVILFLFVLPPILLLGATTITLLGANLIMVITLALTLLFRQILLRCTQPAGSAPLPVSLLSECLQPYHLVSALINRHITWRGKPLKVFADGGFQGR